MNQHDLEQDARNIVNAQDKLRKFLWNQWVPLPDKWMRCIFTEVHNPVDDRIWYASIIELLPESLIFFEYGALLMQSGEAEIPSLELPYSEIIDITDVNPIDSHISLCESISGKYGLHFFIKNSHSVKNSKKWKHIDIVQKSIETAKVAYQITNNSVYNKEREKLEEFAQSLR